MYLGTALIIYGLYLLNYDYTNRSRLPTPSPEPPKRDYANGQTNGHIPYSNTSQNNWFKSLDRLSRRKNKKNDNNDCLTNTDDDLTPKSPPTKNLRFFGDSLRQRNMSRSQTDITNRDRMKSQSNRDLHNISEDSRTYRQENGMRKNYQKSMLNISESDREMNRSMKPNLRQSMPRDPPRRDERGRRNKNEASSLESSTEGDSSQSQRSIVYLHAATVGDIPGPGYLRNSSRAASREELASNSNKIQPRVKTLSRSFSMLAPWKPKNYRESMNIDYSQYPKQPLKNGKYEQKISKNGTSKNSSSSTLKKKAHETRRSNQNLSTLGTHRARSKENISHTLKRSKDEPSRNSTSTLYKKKDRLPHENSRYSRENDKRISSKSASVESLGAQNRVGRSTEDNRVVSRSVSMPRNPEKSAGWFKRDR
ncbi:hypothetical protein HHI36_000979 [Cryptolaemus montrouzieri]|uniref:Uncharacterized protein n=1 Tax=Cryptolaemus montrouzieri TaxID=559131 RepID=A0ABD2P6E9_9CUCU